MNPTTPDNQSTSAKSRLFDRPTTQLENYKQWLLTKESEKLNETAPRSITQSKFYKNSTDNSTDQYKSMFSNFKKLNINYNYIY